MHDDGINSRIKFNIPNKGTVCFVIRPLKYVVILPGWLSEKVIAAFDIYAIQYTVCEIEHVPKISDDR
jgi:hypothetical protein